MKVSGRLKYTERNGKQEKHEGRCKIDLPDSLRRIVAEGDVSFHDIKAEAIKLRGKITGDAIEAGELSIEGAPQLGRVKAETCKIRFSEKGNIGTLHAMCVSATPEENRHPNVVEAFVEGLFGKKLTHKLAPTHDELEIDVLDANRVELKDCTCGLVRCKEAFLKGHCRVRELCYSRSANIADTVEVGTQHQEKYTQEEE